jgi:hypothetical protein
VDPQDASLHARAPRADGARIRLRGDGHQTLRLEEIPGNSRQDGIVEKEKINISKQTENKM